VPVRARSFQVMALEIDGQIAHRMLRQGTARK
jgi:hypothetical protein